MNEYKFTIWFKDTSPTSCEQWALCIEHLMEKGYTDEYGESLSTWTFYTPMLHVNRLLNEVTDAEMLPLPWYVAPEDFLTDGCQIATLNTLSAIKDLPPFVAQARFRGQVFSVKKTA